MLEEIPRGMTQILESQPNVVRGSAQGLESLAEEVLRGLSIRGLGFGGTRRRRRLLPCRSSGDRINLGWLIKASLIYLLR